MTYRGSPLRLFWIVLAWMLIITSALGLIIIGATHPPPEDSRPLRTRPPIDWRGITL